MEIEKELVYPEENIKPQANADGNYNIIFILNNQEHFMREYPMGTTFENHWRYVSSDQLLLSQQRQMAFVEKCRFFLRIIATIYRKNSLLK